MKTLLLSLALLFALAGCASSTGMSNFDSDTKSVFYPTEGDV